MFQFHSFRKRRNNQIAAVMLQVIPSFYKNYSKNSLFISANTHEKIMCVKKTVLLAMMTRCASYTIADITLFYQATIKSCYRNWMHSVSTTNTWTVCIQFSSAASVAKLFSRVDNSLIIRRGQFTSTSKTEEWTECPASRKRDS